MEFRWIPGRGIDLDAVERMKQHFPKPHKAPRVAWFMSEIQEYHTELLEIQVPEAEAQHLTRFLHDTGGGIKNFGRFEEWVVWFRYLLPYLLLRILEDDLLTLTIDYFLNLYSEGIVEEYPGFREDVLHTLAQAIMTSELWDEQDLAKKHDWYAKWREWPSQLYAVMFFCLKYLTIEEIRTWVASIVAIEGHLWQRQIVEWLNGANRLLYYIENPEKLPETKSDSDKDGLEAFFEAASINWYDSYLVFTGIYSSRNLFDYLPKENVEIFWNEVKKYPQLSFSDVSTGNGT